MLLLSQAVGLVIAGVAVVVAEEPLPSGRGTLAWAGLSGVLDLAGLWALYLGLALIAALCFGLGFVTLDAASEGSVVWTLLANRLGSVIVLVAAWGVDVWAGDFTAEGEGGVYVSRVAVRASLPGGGAGDYAAVLAIGVLDLVAVGLFALASTQGLVSVVAALGSLYPVATVMLARVLLRERMTTAKLAGVTVALAGVLAISAA